MPVQDWVIDEIFRNEKFEVRIPYTTINTDSENSDYKYVCLSVATFSVLRSNFFQKYPWFIVSIEEKQTTWNPKKHFFLFEKRKKIQNVICFFEWKTLLDEVDEDQNHDVKNKKQNIIIKIIAEF